MSKNDRKYLILLGVTLVVAVAAQWIAPESLDWNWSLERDDTRPYGSEVMYEVLPALFPDAEVKPVELPPFVVLSDTTVTAVNYVFLTQTFAPDPAEAQRLLAFAERGGTVFVGAADFGGTLADTLNLETSFASKLVALGSTFSADSLGVNFVNPALRADTAWTFREGVADFTFASFDTSRTTVLGFADTEADANYLRVAWGEGAFYLNLVPLAFTNYHLLRGDDAGYAARALSYLPVQETWWDAHYKPQRARAGTPLRYILLHPGLKGAYYLLLGATFLFVLFRAKRRQRIIPVIEPPRNDTLEFVQTIGRLYFQHGDHTDLAKKKITFFLDYIRTNLNLSTHTLDDALLERIAERSGVPPEDVHALFSRIHRLQAQERVTEIELNELSQQIEAFYRMSKR